MGIFIDGEVRVPMRLLVGIMLLMASFTSYILRVNMSINILGMVEPKLTNSSSTTDALPPNYGIRYNWSAEEQSSLLGAYFWGYLITQIPGGILSEWFGARHVIGLSTGFSAIATLLTPASAQLSFWAVFLMRMLTGALGGFVIPASQNVISRWAPPNEKGKFIVTIIGGTLGTVVTWPVAGYIMETMGWTWAFYLPAVFTILMTIAWYLCVYNSPAEHPRITLEEREYIETSLGDTVQWNKKKGLPPIKHLLISLPFWSLLFLHYGNLWALYFLITAAPKYMNQILNFKLAKSGLLAGLPYLCRFLCSFVFASFGDAIRKRNLMSVTTTRKIFCLFSHIIPGLLLLGLGFVGNNAVACITLITVSLGFNGASTVTNLQNAQDLAPNYAATIFAIINFVGTTTGFLAPKVVAYYTKEQNTAEQWNKVFNINAIFYIAPAIFFIFFGSGKIQRWNDLEAARLKDLEAEQTGNEMK